MKKIELKNLTLREKIAQTGCCRPEVNINKDNQYGCHWSVGRLEMMFANMNFTVKNDVKTTCDEYCERRNKINKDLKIPYIGAMDATAGINGAFYEFLPIMNAPIIGSVNDYELAFEAGRLRGECIKRAGSNWWWGPEADLVNRHSEISFGRLYSSDPEIMANMAVAEMKGCQSVNVAATAKHFPGADELEYRDAHQSFQMLHISYEDWEKRQGKIYQKLIDEGVYSFMTSHSSFPAYDSTKENGHYVPASASYKMITELLKGKMGFKGVVITDAIEMFGLIRMFGSREKVYVACLKAGNDMLLGVREDYVDVIEDAVKKGLISEERIDDACKRILDMKEKLGFFDDKEEKPRSIKEINDEINKLNIKLAEKGITVVKDRNNIIPVKKKIKSVSAIVLSSDPELCNIVEEGMGNSFKKRGIEFSVKRDLFSMKEIREISENNDLILYVSKRSGKYKYFTVDDAESFNFLLVYGAEKSIGISLWDPYVCYDKLSVMDTFINAYNSTNEVQEAIVKTILGELPKRNSEAFDVVPKEFQKYEM